MKLSLESKKMWGILSFHGDGVCYGTVLWVQSDCVRVRPRDGTTPYFRGVLFLQGEREFWRCQYVRYGNPALMRCNRQYCSSWNLQN